MVDVVRDHEPAVREPDVELERGRRGGQQPPDRQRVVAPVRLDLECHGTQIRRSSTLSVLQVGRTAVTGR